MYDLLQRFSDLSGLPNEDGTFSWKRISNIHISKAWKKGRSRNRNVDSDYAVLVLKHSHSLKYMKPQASKDRVESTLSFNGYPSDQGGRLWHSSCPVKRIGPNGIFLIRCAGSKGTSGSGVYKSLGYGKYAVTGIVSARVKIAKKGNGRHHTVHTFTIINNLTAAKVKRICRWAERDDC
jgi:V8-like Glu-specific endopeptidase